MEGKERIDTLIQKHGPRLIRQIGSQISNSLRHQISAEEILHEAIAYTLSRPGKWEDRSDENLCLHLLSKAKWLVIDKTRRLKAAQSRLVRHADGLEENGEIPKHQVPSPTYILHKRGKQSALEKLLKSLPSRDQREALKLVRVDGFSVQEAASKMDRSPEAVRKLLRRGVENLIQMVKSIGISKIDTTGITS